MKYGKLPKYIGLFDVDINEMMFYQYLPIKLQGMVEPVLEQRLKPFSELIGAALCDFVADYGLERFHKSYVYLTAKYMYESKGCSFNRKGYHSDGFLTDDINYIWSDCKPTVFNFSKFNLTLDDHLSMKEMDEQADEEKIETYPDNSLLRLDQFVIHRCSNIEREGMRKFLKISVSKDRYDLKGNAINPLLKYKWEYRDRKKERNIPQKLEV
ncbi:hypothetical protein [Flagellimonas sp. SN16]|uniref:hypothetical protein n=1 Tax=Flagellimonas sp. SN16 TaxID=3415142 RepID=UPI003C52D69C